MIGTRFAVARMERGDPRDAGNIPAEFAASSTPLKGNRRSPRGVQTFDPGPAATLMEGWSGQWNSAKQRT